MTLNVNLNEVEAKTTINSEVDRKNTIEAKNADGSFLYSYKGNENNHSDTKVEKEKRYKETLLKDEITKGWLIIAIGILTSITLFGIGFIIIGANRIKKAKNKLSY